MNTPQEAMDPKIEQTAKFSSLNKEQQMNRVIAVLIVPAALAAIVFVAQARPVQTAPAKLASSGERTAAKMYECPICHHKVNAAQAKQPHYTCPADQGKLAPVKTAHR